MTIGQKLDNGIGFVSNGIRGIKASAEQKIEITKSNISKNKTKRELYKINEICPSSEW